MTSTNHRLDASTRTASRQCRCAAPHATTTALAACLWPDAPDLAGTGEYAVVATAGGRNLGVTLWPRPDDALDAKLALDAAAAADRFAASHRIHRLQFQAGVRA
jgi:hypothetical protein